MSIKNLDKFMGEPIKGALERALARTPIPPGQLSSGQPATNPPTPASTLSNPENYILLSEKTYGAYSYPDLLVAMNKTHLGKNWHDCHAELAKEDAFMLTIRQFVDFLNLIKSGSAYDGNGRKIDAPRLNDIYNEITEKRGPWRSEWLDADFKVIDKNIVGLRGKLVMNYEHRIVNGKLTPQRSQEALENYLAKDKQPGIDFNEWLTSATYQGLPPVNIKNGDLWYWQPGRDNNSVAGFSAGSDGAVLNCDRYLSNTNFSLGVRAARKKI